MNIAMNEESAIAVIGGTVADFLHEKAYIIQQRSAPIISKSPLLKSN